MEKRKIERSFCVSYGPLSSIGEGEPLDRKDKGRAGAVPNPEITTVKKRYSF